jgi:hypothetical protein
MARHRGAIRGFVSFALLGLLAGSQAPLAASPRPLVLSQQQEEGPAIEAFLSTGAQGTSYEVVGWDSLSVPEIQSRALAGSVDIRPPFDWSATFIECGTFEVIEEQEINALSDPEFGDGPEAFWSHPNGTGPGKCPHTGTEHVGLIVVELIQSAPQVAGLLDDELWLCIFIGPGTSNVLETEPCELLTPRCEVDATNENILVEANGASVTMTVDTSDTTENVVVEFLGTQAQGCTAPVADVKTITVNGSVADEDVQLSAEFSRFLAIGNTLELAFARGDAAHGTALLPRDSVTLAGTEEADTFSFHTVPGIPGGMGIDVTGDDVPDILNQGVEAVQVFGGGGADVFQVLVNAVPRAPAQGFPSLYFTGEAGADRLDITGTGGNNTITFGMSALGPGPPGPPIYRPVAAPAQLVAAVNVTPGKDKIVDITAFGVEKWSVFGKGGGDVLSGAGGRGTGSAFQFPLVLNGDAGKDTLTGGKKKDVLDGGPGSDTCNGSGNDVERRCEG